MQQIDLNCDMGEGMPSDAEVMPFISSANIACGAHAGDEDTMKRTAELALRYGVAIGAHPSYPDRENFGRTDLLAASSSALSLQDIPAMLEEQILRLQGVLLQMGSSLRHVKPHGALYNRAARDPVVAEIICRTILELDRGLILYGLSGSEMARQAAACGLAFANEVFADRTYQADGSLTPRSSPDALIEDPVIAQRQVLMMVSAWKVETICLHGDGKEAATFASMIHQTLKDNGIAVAAPFL